MENARTLTQTEILQQSPTTRRRKIKHTTQRNPFSTHCLPPRKLRPRHNEVEVGEGVEAEAAGTAGRRSGRRMLLPLVNQEVLV
jgi:hypothetical protein